MKSKQRCDGKLKDTVTKSLVAVRRSDLQRTPSNLQDLPEYEYPRACHRHNDERKVLIAIVANAAVLVVQVWVVHVVNGPVGADSGSQRREENLQHEDPEDSYVGLAHHLRYFVARLGRVHLNLGLMARVDHNAEDAFNVAKGHAS